MRNGDAMANVSFPLWVWLFFVGLVLALLFLDLFVLHRGAKEVPFSEALWLSAGWIAISIAFGGFIWFVEGSTATVTYLTAYLVEKSLSLDNVFVFSVIFSSFAVPKEYRYHVLFYGVLGALVFRAIFIVLGTALLSTFSWLVYVFGAFLVFTGARMIFGGGGGGGDPDPQDNRALKLLRRFLPVTEDYQGDNFVVQDNGRRYATPLLATLVVIEASDVVLRHRFRAGGALDHFEHLRGVLLHRLRHPGTEGALFRARRAGRPLRVFALRPRDDPDHTGGGVRARRLRHPLPHLRLAGRDRRHPDDLYRGLPDGYSRRIFRRGKPMTHRSTARSIRASPLAALLAFSGSVLVGCGSDEGSRSKSASMSRTCRRREHRLRHIPSSTAIPAVDQIIESGARPRRRTGASPWRASPRSLPAEAGALEGRRAEHGNYAKTGGRTPETDER